MYNQISLLLLAHPSGIDSDLTRYLPAALGLSLDDVSHVENLSDILVKSKSLWLKPGSGSLVSMLAVVSDVMPVHLMTPLKTVPNCHVLAELLMSDYGESVELSVEFCDQVIRMARHIVSAASSASMREGLPIKMAPSPAVFTPFLAYFAEDDEIEIEAEVVYCAVGKDLVAPIGPVEDHVSIYMPRLFLDETMADQTPEVVVIQSVGFDAPIDETYALPSDSSEEIDDAKGYAEDKRQEMVEAATFEDHIDRAITELIGVEDKALLDELTSVGPEGHLDYLEGLTDGDIDADWEDDFKLLDFTTYISQAAGLFVVRPGEPDNYKGFEPDRIITESSVVNTEFCESLRNGFGVTRPLMVAVPEDSEHTYTEAVLRVAQSYAKRLNSKARKATLDAIGVKALRANIIVAENLLLTDEVVIEDESASVDFLTAVTVMLPPLGKSKAKMPKIVELMSKRVKSLSQDSRYIGFVASDSDVFGAKPAYTNVKNMFFSGVTDELSMIASYGNVAVYGYEEASAFGWSEYTNICKKYAQSYHETFMPESLTYVFIFKASTGD